MSTFLLIIWTDCIVRLLNYIRKIIISQKIEEILDFLVCLLFLRSVTLISCTFLAVTVTLGPDRVDWY